MRVFSGNANRPLAEEICRHLGIPLGEANTSRFSDGEFNYQINENVRGADVFLVQPTCPPVDASVMELLIMIDAFRRSSADRITAVIPYYGYARKDRKDRPRVPISAKLVANLITKAGADRVLTMDLHAGQIQGFFDIPVDHIFAAPVILEYLANKNIPDLVVVAPDAGGVERARAYAKRLGVDLALADKRREKERANFVEVMNIVGNVNGRNVVIVDDMVDTAGSLTQVAGALREKGAQGIYACCTHAVLSGPAMDRIAASPIKEVVVTNSIPLRVVDEAQKIKPLSVAKLLADAIKSIHNSTSVSKLFI
ncbi:MAG TPA: ribose-phosphate pyrophosphokinase [Acidobacteriota bacterium]|nr:ribose-phosphate pyrophosphokinase [Acidobacteriota bacterium]HMZ78058.1 ribose-phosphate pyrophosphokinase [Acidobacteriota bacterium]HNB69975.1 ribose-phosphate pyrophosphokinase [Acidobacteriota bacterium]HNC44928.1 ribose-phosphate pyrophosphokinase [Acidobacteriota bacterium]HND18125.1 ribose-phosphate pyrophosphokinase [Acidobacteriota bacterium]